MARKGSGGRSKGRKAAPRPLNRKEGTITRWEKPSDILLDEQDTFHASRDRILLDGEDVPSDDEGNEEEVFALKGMSDEEEEDEDGIVEDEEEYDDEDNLEELAAHVAKANAKAQSKKAKSKHKQNAASEEEGSESESEEEGWGRSKAAYYSSNAGQLESDDEEANEMEEQEAKRLQTKTRVVMVDDDFGLGDVPETSVEPQPDLDGKPAAPVIESLPKDKHLLIRHLEKTNPEALALARDWDDIARTLVQTQQKIARFEEQQLEGQRDDDALAQGMVHLYYQALLQYGVTLAFYLYLRSSEEYTARPERLRSHPIMSRLLTFKQHIATLEELSGDDDEYFSGDELEEYQLLKNSQKEAADELRALMEENLLAIREYSANLNGNSVVGKKKKEKKTKETNTEEPPKKKRKASSGSATKPSLPVFDLEEPEFPAKTKSSSRPSRTVDADAFGEQMALDTADAQDKAARKRTLRFHTAKIESASARRERARAGAGGDDDIPWKERKREREERQKREVEKGRAKEGADLDDDEPEPRDTPSKRKREDNSSDEEDEAEDYYDLVKRKSKENKEKKREDYENAKALAREGLVVEDATDGPRALTRAILKNKGLTPQRPKSIRNPRVKKRLRYEKAKKKVASQKAVYKGGISDTGRYEGEKSGISKVIKSRRL